MAELTPETAMEKFLLQPQDICRVVVVTRAPGLDKPTQDLIAQEISQVMAVALAPATGDEMQVDFLIEMDVIADDDGSVL